MLKCAVCETELSTEQQRRHCKYCSAVCRSAQAKMIRTETNPTRNELIGKVPRGTISELLVSVDLMEQGYEVFRALSAACSCDLVAILGQNPPQRIEVKTGSYSSGGCIMFGMKAEGIGKYDILALVMPDQIIYKPPLSPC